MAMSTVHFTHPEMKLTFLFVPNLQVKNVISLLFLLDLLHTGEVEYIFYVISHILFILLCIIWQDP